MEVKVTPETVERLREYVRRRKEEIIQYLALGDTIAYRQMVRDNLKWYYGLENEDDTHQEVNGE